MTSPRPSRNTGPKRRAKELAKELNVSYQQAQQILRASRSEQPPMHPWNAAGPPTARRTKITGHYEAMETYPIVVWGLYVDDPDNVAAGTVGQTTDRIAHQVAARFDCIYEYCVDDDEYGVGDEVIKYYQWYVVVPKGAHQDSRVHPDSPPPIIEALTTELKAALPTSLDARGKWHARPEDGESYQLNAENYCERVYADLISALERKVKPLLADDVDYRGGLYVSVSSSRTGSLIGGYSVYLRAEGGISVTIGAGLPSGQLSKWPDDLGKQGRPILTGPRPAGPISWIAQVTKQAPGAIPSQLSAATPSDLADQIVRALRSDYPALLG